MGIKDIHHAALYYYGEEHLSVKLYHYVKQSQLENDLVYFCIHKELYERLLSLFKENQLSIDMINYLNITETVKTAKYSGFNNLKNVFKDLINDAKIKGFNNVRFIEQPSILIKETGKNYFMDFENIINDLSEEIGLSVLCIYDLCEHFHNRELIDDEVFDQSLETHKTVYSELEIKQIESFSINVEVI